MVILYSNNKLSELEYIIHPLPSINVRSTPIFIGVLSNDPYKVFTSSSVRYEYDARFSIVSVLMM